MAEGGDGTPAQDRGATEAAPGGHGLQADGGATRLRRLLGESVMIVASILAAFAIDAWWDERADDEQAGALVEAMLVDFEAARDELAERERLHRLVAESAERILEWTALEDPVAACRAAEDPYAALLATPSFDPPMGTLATLLASGRLDLLPSEELRAELTRWQALQADLRENEDRANDHLEQSLYPLLRRQVDLAVAVRSGPYRWEPAMEARPSCDIMTSVEFRGAVYRHWSWHQVVLQEDIPRVWASIERVLDALG